MSQPTTKTVFVCAISIAALTMAAGGIALGDDNPPPANPGRASRHNNPAWAACKKQADDQKLERGDARREFMKSCLKSAKTSGAVPAPS